MRVGRASSQVKETREVGNEAEFEIVRRAIATSLKGSGDLEGRFRLGAEPFEKPLVSPNTFFALL